MIKTTLKRIFAIVGASLAAVAAIFFIIAGIESLLAIANDVATNFFLVGAFFLLFGLAFCFIFFGGKVLFSFLNKEDDDQPFNVVVLSFTAFQFLFNLLIICFWGGTAANWVIIVFSFAASLLLLVHVLGIRTAWYTDVIGVGIGMITAITSACANGGLIFVASTVVALICFLIMAIFALCLIKDAPANDEKDDDETV